MSYPPPPGLIPSPKPPPSNTPAHASLPPRPPPAAGSPPSFKPSNSTAPSFSSAPGTRGYSSSNNASTGQKSGSFPAFTGFQPRSVAANHQSFRSHNPVVSAGPAPPSAFTAPQTNYSNNTYQAQPSYQQTPTQSYNQASGYQDQYDPTPPQIRNPFPLPGQAGSGTGRGGGYGRDQEALDPDMEAQILQWQSAYMNKDTEITKTSTRTFSNRFEAGGGPSSSGANTAPLGTRPDTANPTGASTAAPSAAVVAAAANPDTGVASVVTGADGKQKTVVRSGGGQTWQDPSLLEWDPGHFRLFVGNLAGEVTDESLLKAFGKYPSVQKARVVRDKRTTKSRGFGFVSFSDGEEYYQSAKDMQGKYIGSHPVLLRKSTTEIRPTVSQDNHHGKKKGGKGGGGGGGNGGGGSSGKGTGAGIQKKQSKMKGGLKVLG